MFKKYLSLIISLSLLIGCSKKETDEAANLGMEFSISGINDTIYAFQEMTLPLYLKRITGPSQNVALSVYGLPVGMSAKFSVERDTPDFNTSLTIHHYQVVKGGIYPLKIVATNLTTGGATIKKINFTHPNSCGAYLVGEYNLEIIRGSVGSIYEPNYQVSIKADNPDRLYFTYPSSSIAPSFFGDMRCDNFDINIPPKGTTTYKGTYDPLLKYIEIIEMAPAKENVVYRLSRW